MSKTGKVVGIVALVVILLVAGMIFLVKLLITPERVRQVVLPRAQAALDRPVELGEIRVSLFTGIALEEFRVGERSGAGEEPFVATERAVLRYRLWPLLRGKVIVDEIRLVGPKVRVVREPDGSFNFSDLLPEEEGKRAEPKAPAAPGEGKSLDLLISTLVVEDGTLVFLDRKVNGEAPLRFVADQLTLQGSSLTMDRSFPVRLSGQLGGAPFALEGEVNPATRQADLDLSLDQLDVTAFRPYFASALPGELGSMKVSLDLTAKGGEAEMRSSGNLTLEQLSLTLEALPDAPVRDGRLSLDYALVADLEGGVLRLEKAAVDYNGIPLQISGRIESLLEKPVLDLEGLLPGVELRTAMAGLPQGLVAPLSAFDPAGKVRSDFRLAGSPEAGPRLLKKASLELEGVAANLAGGRPSLSGTIRMEADRVASENLVVRLGDDTARLDLRAENLFGKPLKVSLDLKADVFDLDPLVKNREGQEKAKTPAAAAAETGEPGPLDLPLQAEGSLEIGRAGYRGLQLEEVRGRFRLANNRFTLEEFTGRSAGGTLGSTGWVDLARKGFAYGGTLRIDGVQATPLLAAFAPRFAATAAGRLDLETEVRGQGTKTDRIKRHLSGEGDLRLAEGKLTGTGLTRGLAEFLGLESLRTLEFRTLKGHFTIEEGKLSIKSDFQALDFRMAPRGTVGLDGSLDLSLNAALSPELSARLPKADRFAAMLRDDQGWTELPLQVDGSLESPKFGLDTSAAVERAKSKVKEKLQEKVLEKLAPKPAGEDEEKTEPGTPRKQLEDAVRGLFGN